MGHGTCEASVFAFYTLGFHLCLAGVSSEQWPQASRPGGVEQSVCCLLLYHFLCRDGLAVLLLQSAIFQADPEPKALRTKTLKNNLHICVHAHFLLPPLPTSSLTLSSLDGGDAGRGRREAKGRAVRLVRVLGGFFYEYKLCPGQQSPEAWLVIPTGTHLTLCEPIRGNASFMPVLTCLPPPGKSSEESGKLNTGTYIFHTHSRFLHSGYLLHDLYHPYACLSL
jgi:hypothetical protein